MNSRTRRIGARRLRFVLIEPCLSRPDGVRSSSHAARDPDLLSPCIMQVTGEPARERCIKLFKFRSYVIRARQWAGALARPRSLGGDRNGSGVTFYVRCARRGAGSRSESKVHPAIYGSVAGPPPPSGLGVLQHTASLACAGERCVADRRRRPWPSNEWTSSDCRRSSKARAHNGARDYIGVGAVGRKKEAAVRRAASQAAGTDGSRRERDRREERRRGAPASFDWRNVDGANYITAIKDQGGCGSCVAFGTVATLEGTYQAGRGDAATGIDLSEAQLFYCGAGGEGYNCETGWYADHALNYAANPGHRR